MYRSNHLNTLYAYLEYQYTNIIGDKTLLLELARADQELINLFSLIMQ
jgi:hypothetical protein